MITEIQKEQIVRGMEEYISLHGLSNNKFAKNIVEIPASYVSALVNRKWNAMPAGSKLVKIEDKYFQRIAEKVGIELEETFWGHFDTDNYQAITIAMNDARMSKLPIAIDGETGAGKTYAIREYRRQNPSETYLVTCADDLTSKSFMIELAEAVGIKAIGATSTLRKNITRKLNDDANPLLIIDEAENLKDGAWGSIKSMMDALKGKCGIVLIGANDFETTLAKKASRMKRSFPQIYSRIKEGGFTPLFKLSMDDVSLVCSSLGITSKRVINYLFDSCNNMRELSGAVTKLKREAAAMNAQIDVELCQILIRRN